MLCCAALILLIGFGRRLWLRLGGRRGAPADLFAPPARRPAPGATADVPSYEIDRNEAVSVRGGRADLRLILRCAVLGAGCYLVAVAGLIAAGMLQSRSGILLWTLRTVVYLVLAGAALLAARRLGGPEPSPDRPDPSRGVLAAGTMLLAGGLVWYELSLADLHVFRLVRLPRDALGWSLLFHNIGTIGVIAGAITLQIAGRAAGRAAGAAPETRAPSSAPTPAVPSPRSIPRSMRSRASVPPLPTAVRPIMEDGST